MMRCNAPIEDVISIILSGSERALLGIIFGACEEDDFYSFSLLSLPSEWVG